MLKIGFQLVLSTTLLSVYSKAQCGKSNHFDGLAVIDSSNLVVDITYDPSGAIAQLKKTDECFYSIYDFNEHTLYFADDQNNYWSLYDQKSQVIHEEQYISKWFQWERDVTTSLTGARNYGPESEVLHYYVAGTIATFYGIVAIFALINLIIVKKCCKNTRVMYFGRDKKTAQEQISHPSEEDYGQGKDIKQFIELSEKKDTKWKKPQHHHALQGKRLSNGDFSKTAIIVDDNKVESFINDEYTQEQHGADPQKKTKEDYSLDDYRGYNGGNSDSKLPKIMKKSKTQNILKSRSDKFLGKRHVEFEGENDYGADAAAQDKADRRNLQQLDALNDLASNSNASGNLKQQQMVEVTVEPVDEESTKTKENEQQQLYGYRASNEVFGIRQSTEAFGLNNDMISSFETVKPMSKFTIRNNRKRQILDPKNHKPL